MAGLTIGQKKVLIALNKAAVITDKLTADVAAELLRVNNIEEEKVDGIYAEIINKGMMSAGRRLG